MRCERHGLARSGWWWGSLLYPRGLPNFLAHLLQELIGVLGLVVGLWLVRLRPRLMLVLARALVSSTLS